ncbi:MAG: hypothetical protein FJW23_13190 [Acidimicrobiia bacterium]|nr:hypothetical protein [Acidimicrobiia bacterium]
MPLSPKAGVIWTSSRQVFIALLVGIGATLLFQQVIAPAIVLGARALSPNEGFGLYILRRVVPQVLPPLGGVFSGYAVARFSRERTSRMVVSYAVFVGMLAVPRLLAGIVNAAGDPRYIVGLFGYIANNAVVIGAILVGGLWLHGWGNRPTEVPTSLTDGPTRPEVPHPGSDPGQTRV